MAIITARFASLCRVCGGIIQVGDKMDWDTVLKGVAHEKCLRPETKNTLKEIWTDIYLHGEACNPNMEAGRRVEIVPEISWLLVQPDHISSVLAFSGMMGDAKNARQIPFDPVIAKKIESLTA